MGRVARRADMDHRRNVVLDHLLVDRIPVAVAERRVLPMPARRIGVQIDADESIFVDAALALHLELAIGDRFTDLVVGNSRAWWWRLAGLVRLDLLAAPALVLTGGGRVVAVTIDDHAPLRFG